MLKLWTFTYVNNAKEQIDYILMNKKWINCALNFEAYYSFKGESTYYRIVTEKICLSLRRNMMQTTKTTLNDWSLPNNRDNCNKVYIYIYIRGLLHKFPDFFSYGHFY